MIISNDFAKAIFQIAAPFLKSFVFKLQGLNPYPQFSS